MCYSFKMMLFFLKNIGDVISNPPGLFPQGDVRKSCLKRRFIEVECRIRLSFVLINHDFSMDAFHPKNQQVMILRNPSRWRDSLFVFCWFSLFLISSTLSAQGVNGVARDVVTLQPISNCTIRLIESDTIVGTVVTGNDGKFSLKIPRAGRVQVSAVAMGYLVKLSDEMVLDGYSSYFTEIELQPVAYTLGEVMVTAGKSEPPFVHRITKDDLNTIAGNYDDPVRVAHSKPGIVLINDQANHISVRGQNPVFNTWYLEGLEIVNPSHTNNAGTLFDRPTYSGGGINMFSAQALGSTDIYTGVNPLTLPRSIGAATDMHLHHSANPEFRVKAGLLGFEAGGGMKPSTNSVLDINLRYSFTGLLTDLGADFGDEKIGYYDGVISFYNEGLRHQFKLFGWAGRSKNEFDRLPRLDPKDRYKDFFNIDYENDILGAGVSYDFSLSDKSGIKVGAAYSMLNTAYSRFGIFSPLSDSFAIEDDFKLLSTMIEFSTRVSSKINYLLGANYNVRSFQNNQYSFGPFHEETLLRPYTGVEISLTEKLDLSLGVDLHYAVGQNSVEPGYRMQIDWTSGNSLLFAGYRRSTGPGLFIEEDDDPEFLTTDQMEAGWKLNLPRHIISVTAYYQQTDFIPVLYTNLGYVNIANFAENVPGVIPVAQSNAGRGRYYGVEAALENTIGKKLKYNINQSLYWSQHSRFDSVFQSGRYDGRFATHASLSREIIRERNNKNRIWNFSVRGLLHGGLKEPSIHVEQSMAAEKTIYVDTDQFDVQLAAYKRIDLGISRTIANEKIRWRFALDVQNLLGFENEAFHYYDPFLQRVEVQHHLGVISVLSVQASW